MLGSCFGFPKKKKRGLCLSLPSMCTMHVIHLACAEVEQFSCIRGKRDIHNLSLKDMDLKIDIEKLFPNADHPENTTHQNPLMDIIESETFNEGVFCISKRCFLQ
jgi:hypothetical protein